MKPETSVDEEFKKGLHASASSYLRMADIKGDGYLPRARRSLLEGLLRLDALPREDPFWKNTNGLATLHKLRNFNCILRHRNPGDNQAL